MKKLENFIILSSMEIWFFKIKLDTESIDSISIKLDTDIK